MISPNFCVNCIHYSEELVPRPLLNSVHTCNRDVQTHIDMITGKEYTTGEHDCVVERMFKYEPLIHPRCNYDGQYFEAKYAITLEAR